MVWGIWHKQFVSIQHFFARVSFFLLPVHTMELELPFSARTESRYEQKFLTSDLMRLYDGRNDGKLLTINRLNFAERLFLR